MSDEIQNKPKKQHWKIHELEFLIDILTELDIPAKMDGKKFRNQELFKIVQEKLAEKEVHRSIEQVIAKFKQIKLEYHGIKDNNQKSGRATKTMIFVDKIDSLFSKRPRATFPIAHGVDSGEIEGKYLNKYPKRNTNI